MHSIARMCAMRMAFFAYRMQYCCFESIYYISRNLKIYYLWKTYYFCLFIFAILCTGCSRDKDNSDAEDCSEVICTDEFCSIGVKIKYEDDTSVVLDSYEVIEVATGKVRDVLNWGEEFHTYTIASDLDRGDFAGKEIELQFVGKIGEK